VRRALAALLAACAASGPRVAAAAEASGPAERREPLLSLGARIGPQSIYLEGDGSPSDLRGYVLGAQLTLRLSRHLGIAGAVEGSVYDRRSDRLEPGPAATSVAAFAQLHVDTNPEGPWAFVIDLGPGFRWLQLPLASGPTDQYGGLEPLRLRMGPALHHESLELSVALGVGFGWFVARPGARDCAVTGTCQDSLLDSDTASPVHFVGDLSIALAGWP
jgi:hypothetical protein